MKERRETGEDGMVGVYGEKAAQDGDIPESNRWKAIDGAYGRTMDRRRREDEWPALRSLGVVEPEALNVVGDSAWEELEMALDSGAAETVGSGDMLASVDITEGDAMRK